MILDYIRIYGSGEAAKGKILTRVNPKILFKEVLVIK